MADGILNPIEQLEADFDFDVYTKQEVDALLDEKADKSDTYTKTETDALLDDKADADSVYTKTETDTLLSAKADKSTTLAGYGITDAYTKTQTDNLLNGKADADSVYTKTEINTKIPNTVGSATKPTYVNGGVLTECTYELNKTVPANAVFTDTTYTAGNGLNLSGTSFSAKAGTNVTVDGNGINVNGSGAVASADSGLLSGGTAYTELRPTLDGTWVKNAQTTAINLQKLEGGIEYLYAILSKQYDQLKKYINGNYYDYDTDANSKYTKSVPQGAMPYASLEQIGGKTLAWNQLCGNTNATQFVTKVTDGHYVVNGNPAYYVSSFLDENGNIVKSVSGHKYFVRFDCDDANIVLFCGTTVLANSTVSRTNSSITTINSVGNLSFRAGNSSGTTTYTNCNVYVTIVDLTLCYGAGNEPSTVEEFTAQFPASYYPYNAGTLLSAGVTEVVSKGANLIPTYITSGSGSGLTWTANADGSMTINGTATATTTIDAPTSTWQWDGITPCWLSGCPAGGNINNGYSLRVDGVGGTNQYSGYDTGNGEAFAVALGSITEKALYFRIVIRNGTVCNNLTFRPMLNYGTSAKSYAPYVGTIATYPIPAEVQALEGYGWSCPSHYNYIDFEAKKFIQEVGSRTYASGDESDATVITDGTNTYYALNPAVETDISSYLTDDNLIEVEAGGTLTFPNQHGDDYRINVPSAETYMVDLQSAL